MQTKQDCLSDVHNLSILKLHVRPDCLTFDDDLVEDDDDELENEVKELRYDKKLEGAREEVKQMADEIFARLGTACPRLVAVVIGLHDDLDAYSDCHGFIRMQQTNVFGKTTSVVFPVDEDAIRDYGPSYEVDGITERQDLLAY